MWNPPSVKPKIGDLIILTWRGADGMTSHLKRYKGGDLHDVWALATPSEATFRKYAPPPPPLVKLWAYMTFEERFPDAGRLLSEHDATAKYPRPEDQDLSIAAAISVKDRPEAVDEDVRRALASLLPRQAAVLHAFYERKVRISDIARELNVTPTRVRQIIQTARVHCMNFMRTLSPKSQPLRSSGN